jgi:hypothetical protein
MADKEAASVVTAENATTFYAERLGLAENEPSTEVESVKKESEPVEAQDQSEPEAKVEAEKQDKRSDKLNKRFDKVTQRAKDAEARAADLEKRLRDIESRQAAPAPEPVKERDVNAKPQAHQFNDAFEYAEALAEWSAENALKQRDVEEAQRKAQKAQEKVAQEWAKKIEKAKTDLPDFDAMVQSSTVAVSDEIRDSILESDVGPQLLYFLASDEEFADKLTKMPTAKALREIGRLEARFEQGSKPKAREEKPAREVKAPEPIKPLTGGKNVAQDVLVDTNGEYYGSYAQWKAARQAGKLR